MAEDRVLGAWARLGLGAVGAHVPALRADGTDGLGGTDMGYYTSFELTYEGATEAEVVAALREEVAYLGHRFLEGLCPTCGQARPSMTLDRIFEETMKWYSWEADLAAVSRALPGATLTLSGEGEEQGDVWRAVAKDGEVTVRRARLVFDEE